MLFLNQCFRELGQETISHLCLCCKVRSLSLNSDCVVKFSAFIKKPLPCLFPQVLEEMICLEEVVTVVCIYDL